MKKNNGEMGLPSRMHNAEGAIRHLGVEIEFAGMLPHAIANTIVSHFAGEINWQSPFDLTVTHTQLGDFIVELDSDFIKRLGKDAPIDLHETNSSSSMETQAMNWLSRLAGELVPWEVVSAPITIDQLHLLLPFVDALREQGARGTRHSLHYAFGVHLNPELPALDVNTIRQYLRAYFCLYDGIEYVSEIDLARKLTPYIKHFDKNYIALLVNKTYQPDLATLMDDYLLANPTRNRSLDMLPLFSHLDESRVKATVSDPRVKSRPTFHYRLPNCDIDNPEWNLHLSWNNWLKIESLANDSQRLDDVCDEYLLELNRLTHSFENRWQQRSLEILHGF